jgi:hypothetical protein
MSELKCGGDAGSSAKTQSTIPSKHITSKHLPCSPISMRLPGHIKKPVHDGLLNLEH